MRKFSTKDERRDASLEWNAAFVFVESRPISVISLREIFYDLSEKDGEEIDRWWRAIADHRFSRSRSKSAALEEDNY